MRQIRSKWSEAWAAEDAPKPLPMPLQPMLVAEVEAAVRESHKEDWMYTPAGQSVVGINKIQPAAESRVSPRHEAGYHGGSPKPVNTEAPLVSGGEN